MLATQAAKARALLKFLVYNKATCSFVCAERPNFVFVSFPLRRFCLRFHLFLECRHLKLDRNYFNARAMLAALAIKVANARAMLVTRVANCSRPKIINAYLQLNLLT